MAPRLTPDRYRQIVSQIPEKDVVSAINTSDARDGLGNEYSMFLLNQYFSEQLPTQQIAAGRRQERAPGDTTPVTQQDSTAPANLGELPENFVGRVFGATPQEESRAFDLAFQKKEEDFFAEVSEDPSMTDAEKAAYARENALRYVRNWFDIPRTAQGKEVPAASVDRLKNILEKQGLAALGEAFKSRTYTLQETIETLQAQGQSDPQAAREARRLMSEFITGEEDEARYMEIRPQIRARAQEEVKDNFNSIATEYLESQGFEFIGPQGKWVRTLSYTTPGGRLGYLGSIPEETESETVEIDAPESFRDLIAQLNQTIQSDPGTIDGVVGPDSRSKVEVLEGARDYFNTQVNRVEERIVQANRQEDARHFYRESVDLVRKKFEENGIPLPDITPGQEGTEQRAQYDALPENLKNNYSQMMQTAIRLGRQKTQEHDFVIYRDYLEDELGISGDEDRMLVELYPGGPTLFTIDYTPDDLKTKLFGGARDLGYSLARYETESGDVAETFVGTGFRGLGGLIRIAMHPVFDAFTYDVDQNGAPVDPTDWNYRFDQWVNRALERFEEGHDVTGPLSGARYLTDAIGVRFAEIIPSRMAKTVSTGPRGRMNTGNFFKDVAVEIHNNRFLGDDFNELVATRSFWEQQGMPWVPGAAGLGVEVALPLTPYPFVASAVRNTGKTLQAVDRALNANKLSELMNIMREQSDVPNIYKHPIARRADPETAVGTLGRLGRVMESPVREAQFSILASVARNVMRTARGVDELGDLNDVIAQEARLPRQLAVRLAGEMIELLDLSGDYNKFLKSLETVRGMHWGTNNTQMINIIEDLAGAAERVQKAKKTNSIADLKNDPQGQVLIDEMGVQSAMGIQPSSDDFLRGVLHGYLTEKVANELVNYIPNRYVMATANVIVPMDKWKKNRKAIQAEISESLKVDEEVIKAGAGYKYENTQLASELMVRAYGMAKINNTPFLKDVYRKLRKDEPLTMDEFTSIDEILRGSIVKGNITDSYRLTHTSAVSERAAQAASGRQLTLPRYIEDFRRATNLVERTFAYVNRNPTPPPAKVTPTKMPEGVELAKIDAWREITDRFAGLDDVLRKEILAARAETGDPWLGMTAIMQKYGSDSPVDDVMSVLFGSPSKMTSGFFGDTAAVKGLDWDTVKNLVANNMKKTGLESFSPAAIIESINAVRTAYPALAKRSASTRLGSRQPAGKGRRANAFTRFMMEEKRGEFSYKRIYANDTPAQRAAKMEHNDGVNVKLAARTDYADAQVYAFIVDAKKDEIIKDVATRLNRMYPELTIPLSRPGSINEDLFRGAVAEALMGATKADPGLSLRDPGEINELVDELIRRSAQVLFRGESNLVGGMNAADMRYAMNSIIKDIYDNGTMNMLSYQRIADVFYRRAGLQKDPGLVAVASRAAKVKEVVTRTIQKHIRKTTRESDWLPDTPAKVDELATLISGRIMSDFIESATGQTIDTLMGNLSSVGLPVRIDSSSVKLPEMRAAFVQLGDDFAILMPNQTKYMIDPQELLLLEELIKSSAKGDLERNLQNLRARDESVYNYYINNIGHFYNWSKRATIGGLLGGFGPFAALRFHGVNVFTAPLIISITMPQMALKSLRSAPGAALSFTKPVAEAITPSLTKAQKFARDNIPGASNSFNWLSNKFSHDPNKILFTDKWGSPWTRARYQESVRRNNIRFSQVTYEFRDSVINEVRRAAATLPNLTQASLGTQILRWFNPANKSLWTRWAEEADMAYREGVYAAALKEGAPEKVAGNLARNALLDYGSLPRSERNIIAKGMLFYAFQRQMLMETAFAFVRGGDNIRLLRAQMTFAMRQQQEMEVWAYNEDWQKTRLWARSAEGFDYVKNYLYGVEPPALGTLADLVNLAGALLDSGLYLTGKQPTTYFKSGDVLRAAEDTLLAHPIFQWGLDEIALGMSKGTDLQPQGMMRPEWVYFFQNTGSWAIAQRWFELVPVPADRRKPNEYLQITAPDGTPMYTQWKFKTKKGRRHFMRFYMLSTIAGANRVMRDWSTSAIIDDESEDIVFKRRGEGNTLLNLFGLETPGSLESPAGIVYTQAGQRVRMLNSMKSE